MKIYPLWLFLIVFSAPIFAQNNFSENTPNHFFSDGLELYQKKQFLAAIQKFKSYQKNEPNGDKKMEASYYLLASKLELHRPTAQKQLLNFIQKFPNHSITERARLRIAAFYFQQQYYTDVVTQLEKVAFSDALDSKILDAKFQLAVSYFETENNEKAQSLFKKIAVGGKYASVASYYAASFTYQNGEYETALQHLEIASKDSDLENNSNLMKLAIYFRQQQYQKVISTAIQLQHDAVVFDNDINLLVGEAYFQKNDYRKAILFFEKIVNTTQNSIDFYYHFGKSYLEQGKLDKAISLLNKVIVTDNSFTQIAAYDLGKAYVKLKKYYKASLVFKQVARLNGNAQLQQEGKYHYLKTLFEISDFETVKVLSKSFLDEYPNSKNADEITHFYTEALTSTASSSCELLKSLSDLDIQLMSSALRRTYQKAALSCAVENYNNTKYRLATFYLKKSLDYQEDIKLTNAAYYWLGESFEKQHKPDSAIRFYKKIALRKKHLRADLPYLKGLYTDSRYNLAYIFYNQEEYGKAVRLFEYYSKNGETTEKIGRSFLLKGNAEQSLGAFQNAIASYQNALIYISDKNKVHFNMGLAYENQGKIREAEIAFEKINYNTDPRHKAQAYYHLGVLARKKTNYLDAQKWLQSVQKDFPNFEDMPNVTYMLGDIQYNIGKQKQGSRRTGLLVDELYGAITNLRKVVQNFPSSQYAGNAYLTLKNINREYNNPVADIERLAIIYKNNNSASSEIIENDDYHEVIEKYYHSSDFASILQDLLNFKQQYPHYKNIGYIDYNIGNTYVNLERPNMAIPYFDRVNGHNKARAKREAANITLQQKNYAAAVTRYEDLLNSTTENSLFIDAYFGLMEACFFTQEYEKSRSFAQKVINDISFESSRKSNAYFFKGKAALALGDFKEAIIALANLTNTIGEKPAEAQYLIGKAYREMGKYQESTDELLLVKNRYVKKKNRYWKEKALLLIAQNELDTNNEAGTISLLEDIINHAKITEIRNEAKTLLSELNNGNNIGDK